MRAAAAAVARAPDPRLLIVDGSGRIEHVGRAELADHLRPGDLVVANDAATIPASLTGVHARTARPIEIRLAGRRSLDVADVRAFTAVAFGNGDHRTRTEDREPPPELLAGDRLALGSLGATVTRLAGHPRLIEIRFGGSVDDVWAGIAKHGRPIQYAHVREPLAMWDVWTRIAARPVAFEPPSAGFALDWATLAAFRAREIGFATLTHAAGISSTGDPGLDARLPLGEAYHIPEATSRAIAGTRGDGGRVIAVGTTVTRALEHAAALDPRRPVPRPGPGYATQRIGGETKLRVVDAILTGAHEPGESHYELLRAFAGDEVLRRVSVELEGRGYRSHEFGDSVLLYAERGGTAESLDRARDDRGVQLQPVSAHASARSARHRKRRG